MSFTCRFNNDNNCEKLHTSCHPGRKGCILEGRIALPPSGFGDFTNDTIPRAKDNNK